MKSFLDHDFLLSTPTALRLYQEYASSTPIVDYHCHINPEDIAKDRHFENITEVWLGGDHYKWRLMRSNGVDEKYITGDASPREKFQKWAQTLAKAIGNPLYHWSHLELRRYFDYDGILNEDTAQEVWNLCNSKLQSPSMSVRGLINQSNVKLICTTDDPIDDLHWHQELREDISFKVKVLPAWRPDKAMNLDNITYLDYLSQLSKASGITITDFKTLKFALINRMDYFQKQGCCISDHGINYIYYAPASEETVNQILLKRLQNQTINQHELLQFKTAFMQFVAKEYHKRDWVMQLHFGCKRNNNTLMFNKLGADTGYDCIDNYAPSSTAADFLNSLITSNQLPKTVLYSLNPNDNAYIGTLLGCFQDSSAAGKLQQGSAWWFNDHKQGMIDQMTSLANLGLLSNFIGMLTDSRSFLSYTRHEYFRRILCELIGNWVENGEYPDDYKSLEEIIKDISYNNAVRYFNLPVEEV